jgi:sec-independent protein translocase protein TatC
MSKDEKQNDRLDSTMSLGDHLEELRARLILALAGLAVAVIVCLFLGKPLIKFLERPYRNAMAPHARDVRVPLPEDANSPAAFIAGKYMIFIMEIAGLEHDKPTGVTVQVAMPEDPNSKDPNTTAKRQLVMAEIEPEIPALQVLKPAEGFTSYMKISLIAGLVLAAPWVFYHIWMFIAAGLYANERRYIKKAVPFSAGLFIAGALFFLFGVAPRAMQCLVLFNKYILNAKSEFTFAYYISFVTTLMLVFGMAFQTPIAVYLLSVTDLVSAQTLRSSRKYVFLVAFIVGAIATPPDPFTQVAMAIPLYLLFELGIILGEASKKRRRAQSA